MLQSRIARTLRIAPVLAIVVNLILAAFGARGLPVAEAATFPAARIQIVVGQVEILDDRDGGLAGAGEMHFHTSLYQCLGDVPCLDRLKAADWNGTGIARYVIEDPIKFSANSGETETLNLVYPETTASVARGLDVSPTDHYVLRFYIEEWDDASDDEDMGEVFQALDLAENGLGLGAHVGRATGADSNHVGDFIIHYEIRRAPLPDLSIGSIQVKDLPDSAKHDVCVGVVNREAYPAGGFEVSLVVNENLVPGAVARVNGLGGGTSETVCIQAALPATGQVTVAAQVDAPHVVDEYNELNNVFKQQYTPAPRPTDLSITSVKVNGQDSGAKNEKTDSKDEKRDEKVDCKDPKKKDCKGSKNDEKDEKGTSKDDNDAKSDCSDGTNTVTVVVKNGGVDRAEKFVVRLAADGLVAGVQTIDVLPAGDSRDVTFDDILLKKGKHQLVATADLSGMVVETDEQNNALTVTVTCAAK